MKILFFTKGDKSVASSRFRVWFVADRLKKQFGYDFEILHSIGYPLWKPSLKRIRILRNAIGKIKDPEVKIIFIHKSLFPLDFVWFVIIVAKRNNKKIIYDLDDAEWLHSGTKSRLLVKYADVVFCGSHAIRDWARQYNKNLELIPTAIDHELYLPFVIQPQERAKYTLAWQGMASHLKDGHLGIVKEIFDNVFKSTKVSFRAVILSSNVEGMKDLFKDSPYEVLIDNSPDWANDPVATARVLKKYEVDLAFNPLFDTPWNRAKCAFKAIECMACGVPTLQSAVGENIFVTNNGVNGFTFSLAEEGSRRTIELIENLELRRTFSKESLNTIREKYSYQSIIPKQNVIITSLIA